MLKLLPHVNFIRINFYFQNKFYMKIVWFFYTTCYSKADENLSCLSILATISIGDIYVKNIYGCLLWLYIFLLSIKEGLKDREHCELDSRVVLKNASMKYRVRLNNPSIIYHWYNVFTHFPWFSVENYGLSGILYFLIWLLEI